MSPERDYGWLLVGHGTRNRVGVAEFLQLAGELKQQTAWPVEPCFLELAEPTPREGLAALAAQGVKKVVVVPLLLFTAGHAKHDIPELVKEAAVEQQIEIVGQSPPLELQEQLLELSRQRVQAHLAMLPEANTQLLFVGRGSSDAEAIERVHEYANAVGRSCNLPVSVAFVAAANPRLADALALLATQNPAAVIVLPHLLFQGEVFNTIVTHVEKMQASHPHIQWRLADYLGPHPLVQVALLERALSVRFA